MDVTILLLGISAIIFFGYFAEIIFKKTYVPDLLFLILLGIGIGPTGLNLMSPLKLSSFAPLFTAFALFFLVYNGAFNISIRSFLGGLKKGTSITLFNFFLSAFVIETIMYLTTGEVLLSLLAGFIMGGISSAFVIPVLTALKPPERTYSILVLESTFTDVLTIVFSLSIMEIIQLDTFNASGIATRFFSLFAIAILIGIIAAIVWLIMLLRVLKESKSYMLTVAYLILVYASTEFLGGSGVIAALFFGLTLGNSKTVLRGLQSVGAPKSLFGTNEGEEEKIISEDERNFYAEISFVLKTFFFVYLGMLFSVYDTRAIIIGLAIAGGIMAARMLSGVLTMDMKPFERSLISATFARGLAAAVIAQEALIRNIPNAEFLVNVTNSAIIFMIVLSSVKIFMCKRRCREFSL